MNHFALIAARSFGVRLISEAGSFSRVGLVAVIKPRLYIFMVPRDHAKISTVVHTAALVAIKKTFLTPLYRKLSNLQSSLAESSGQLTRIGQPQPKEDMQRMW